MKEIVVNSKAHGIHTILIDDEDYEKVKQYKWCVYKTYNTFYSIRHIRIDGKGTTQSLHRFIMGLEKGDKRVIDHLDGNGLNNQKANLRICTNMENTQGYRCVNKPPKNVYITPNNTFRATIKINGKKYQKKFKTEDEAKDYLEGLKKGVELVS